MQIETPLYAEHQLDQLAAQFEYWRQTRTHPGERFPQALWEHAVALGPCSVVRSLIGDSDRFHFDHEIRMCQAPHLYGGTRG
jgi:hypothetical protein